MDKNLSTGKIQFQEGVISIVANIGLFALKLWAGIVSGSLALRADAWHTLSDSISSVIVVIAAKYGAKPADKKHPFGHGRAGLIASLFIGFLLVVIGFEFAKGGVTRLIDHSQAHFGRLAIIVTIVSIVVKELMAQYAYWGYRKTKDASLKADGWHHRSDALSSVVMLLGILLGSKFWWIDGVLSFIIAGLMAYAAWEIISEGMTTLLGERPSDELENGIRDCCKEIVGDCEGLHHIHLHSYGNHREITFHLDLDPTLNLGEAHDIIDKLEVKIRSELNIEATIHPDPKEL